MRCAYACGSADHGWSRRQFLTGLTASGTLGLFGGGFAGMIHPAAAKELASAQKRVLLIWLNGGVSQLETWDPKPGTNTGGPFRAIPTSVPGIHISELLPHTARQMHHLALVRSINTQENNHAKGAYIMHTGRREQPGMEYPHLGSVMAKLLTAPDNPLPGYIHITPRGDSGFGKQDAAFLGPRYASVTLADGKPPANFSRPEALTDEADQRRNQLRDRLSQRFAQRRRTAETEAYSQSYEQAAQLIARKSIFDLSQESPRDLERYGTHDFGRHCLLARRLLEHGITFVKVSHTNYDTHYDNFDFHLEQLGEFDRTFATLVEDLHQRGLLSSTLVLVMSEFGRTPTINRNYGRDHWGSAWSVALGGCGIQGGAVVGKTNANGTAVVDRMVHGGHLFHTYFRALGLNPHKNHYHNQQPIPMADPTASAIEEVLA
ncbi:MAG: DUF1501 domain-containing protein [Gemmataceae bacterium]|nr:DUF1501 domain-containing protein [Gemmataceae bacterium]MDW8264112.1 DUF1501 domain-containing protein [Gemmataceae bacterium]